MGFFSHKILTNSIIVMKYIQPNSCYRDNGAKLVTGEGNPGKGILIPEFIPESMKIRTYLMVVTQIKQSTCETVKVPASSHHK